MFFLLSLGVTSVVHSGPLLNQPVPFSCSSVLYQSIGKSLRSLDPDTGEYNQIGEASPKKYNAIGWDIRTNLIYGFRKADKVLFRIDASGVTQDLGRVTDANGNTLQASTQSGDMDDKGNLWLFDQARQYELVKVNIDNRTFQKIKFGGDRPANPNDLVYIASTNSLWGIKSGHNTLVRFDLTTNTITTTPVSGLPDTNNGYGAAWTNIDDELLVSNNKLGGLYRINGYLTGEPSAAFIIPTAVTSRNDGTSCPLADPLFKPPSTGGGTLRYADSGSGQYKDRILFMDWKDSSLKDGIQAGDVVKFDIPESSCMANGTLTATFSNVDDPGRIASKTKPNEMNTWGGSSFYQLYDTAGTGEALYTPYISPTDTSNHLGFTIDWNMVIDGQTRSPDIFFIDAESTTEGFERIDVTTNGGAWSVIENALGEDYVADGIGSQQVEIKNTENPDIDDNAPNNEKSYSPLLLSKETTSINVILRTLNHNGKQAAAFGLLVPCDRGDAPSSYGNAAHAFIEEAISVSKNQLGLKFKQGTPYIGPTPPDSESTTQQDADPALGDDNHKDAFDTNRDDDENIEIPQLPLLKSVDIVIPIIGSGNLSAWVDWNADGDFGDANEQVLSNLSVNTGNASVTLNVPRNATIGASFARFRVSSESDLLSVGYAKDGEVEDVAIEIIEGGEVCFIDDLATNMYSTSSISANSSYLSESTRVYQAKFNNDNWTGHLLAYNLETANDDGNVKSLQWDAANTIGRLNRKIFTYNPSLSSNRGTIFKWLQFNTQQKTILKNGKTVSMGKKLFNWIKGKDDSEGTLFRQRTTVLGDIIHSNLAFKDNLANYGYENLPEGGTYNTFLARKKSSTPTIFVGANDGMLHAFDAVNGTELFAFVPNEVFPKLPVISNLLYGCKDANCLPHEYLVDGPSSLGDAYYNSNWHTVLLGALGKGGKGIFALDVTNAESFVKGNVLWEISSTQATSAGSDANKFTNHLGDSLTTSSVVRIHNSNADQRWAAVVANGYNSNNHQAALFIIDIKTGALIKMLNTGVGSEDQPNGLSSPIAVDSNNDSIVDKIYAGDLHGNLWAFDVSDGNPNNWSVDFGGAPLFTTVQPITAPPQVGKNPTGGLMVYFGTGRYFDVSDNLYEGAPTVNTYFGIHDNGSSVNKNSLVRQTVLQESAADGTNFNARIISKNRVNFSTHHGWFMDLPSSGERVISQALLRQGRLIFTTMTPPGNICEWGGTSWLMEFDALEGRRLDDIPLDINNDKEFTEADNVVYQGEPTIISGIQDPTLGVVFSTPAVINHNSRVEGKYLTGTGGSIGMFRESSSRLSGRMSWRQIR